MASKNLILFTVSYPYGNKEVFLESEIKYLSQAFDQITIIPSFVGKNIRQVPKNVNIDCGFSETNSNLKFLFWSMITKHTYLEIIKNISILFSIQKLQRLLSFTGRGVALFRYLKREYSTKNIYYSYWLNGAVFASYLYNKKVAHIDYVARVHRGDLYLEENNGYLPLRETVFKDIKKIFPISENAYSYILEHYLVDKSRLDVSRLGTEERRITSLMSKSPLEFHLLSCSYISAVKRIDFIIKSLSIIANNNPTIKFFWTHIGAEGLFDEMKNLASEILPSNVVVKFTGNMSNSEVFSFYEKNNIDLFINTSKSEGIPMTFMEAMSCSIPVLALNVGGIGEIINNKNGIILDKNSTIDTLAESLDLFVKNKKLLYEKKQESKLFWNKHYNAKQNYQNFANKLLNL